MMHAVSVRDILLQFPSFVLHLARLFAYLLLKAWPISGAAEMSHVMLKNCLDSRTFFRAAYSWTHSDACLESILDTSVSSCQICMHDAGDAVLDVMRRLLQPKNIMVSAHARTKEYDKSKYISILNIIQVCISQRI